MENLKRSLFWRRRSSKKSAGSTANDIDQRGDSTSSAAAESSGGSLNPMQQLVASYSKVFKTAGIDEAWRKAFFQKVRILVLGRSGAGKTTLIRLIVGKHGPQSVSEGVPGVQNIDEEFIYSSEDQNVPLSIHDSNGIDVKGKERLQEIKTFLDKHQKGDDFSERIHIVWYVISAIDSRCVDDGDVLQLINEYKIPLLLIMTHDDHDKKKVSDVVLNKLLQRVYATDDERENVKELMVRVGNDGVSMGANNELVIDESKRDTKGLKLVVKRTQQLMDKKLRYTWIAVQAVDVEAKLDMSAGIIAGYARRALLVALPRAIPLADPLKLTIIFYRVIVIMGKIWVVPPELHNALNETMMWKEAGCHVLRRVGGDLVCVAGLLITVVATVLSAGAALPSVIAMLAASGVLNMRKSVPILVKTFSLQVLGTILYVKSSQVGSSKHRWKPGVSQEEYVRLCEEFAHNAEYQRQLVDFAKQGHSMLDTAVRMKKVKGIMKSKILDIYRRMLRDRPSSLLSNFLRDELTTDDIVQDDEKSNDLTSSAAQDIISGSSNAKNNESTSSDEEDEDDDQTMESMNVAFDCCYEDN